MAGPVELLWRKRRWFCDEPLCPLCTFTEQVPRLARATARLREAVVGAVIDSRSAVSETARAHGASWWLVQAALTAAAVLLPEADALHLVGQIEVLIVTGETNAPFSRSTRHERRRAANLGGT